MTEPVFTRFMRLVTSAWVFLCLLLFWAAACPVRAQEKLPSDSLLGDRAGDSAATASDSARAPSGRKVTGGDRLGSCLATLSDQNADGSANVAVAAPGSDRSAVNAGAVVILSGRSGDTLRVLAGEKAGDAFGASLAALADLDLDGVADFAVGATNWDRNDSGGIDVGKVYVFSGATGDLLFSLEGGQRNGRLGQCLAGLGDTNGDGVADLAAGQIRFLSDTLSGRPLSCVWIVSGANGAILHQIVGLEPHDRFGSALSSAGDLDGDGASDLLVGAYRHSHEESLSAGAVYAISGRTGTILREIQGEASFEQFGYAVAGGHDVDGDRTPDLAVGVRFQDQDGGRRGRVSLYSGANGTLIGTLSGFKPGSQFGSTLKFTSDLDGDSRSDLLVGASGRAGGQEISEAVYLVSSRSGTELLSVSGLASGDRFGCSLEEASDLDGDGRADLFVGACHSALGGQYSGMCCALSGRTGKMLWTRSGRSSLQPAESKRPEAGLMNLEQLQEEVAGYGFPVYDTNEVDAAPFIRRSVAAVYPASALNSGLTGWVKVKVLVLPDGSAAEFQVTDDAGLGPDFREAAVNAAHEWTFLAASLGGEEVACWAVFAIGFAPPLPPEEQRRIDSLAALSDSSRLSVERVAAFVPMAPGDSTLPDTSFYELNEVDVPPVLAARVEPDYPTPALISGEVCTVKLRLLVNRGGAVADVQIGDVSVRGKGFEGAAVAAVRRWRYEPARKGQDRVAVWVTEEIRFVPPGTGQN